MTAARPAALSSLALARERNIDPARGCRKQKPAWPTGLGDEPSGLYQVGDASVERRDARATGRIQAPGSGDVRRRRHARIRSNA
jgi:hypothetical protein